MMPDQGPELRAATRCRGDAGFVGGAEGVLFGVVVFVAGMLLMINAWAVVDAKMALSSAARETARALVESDGAVGPAAERGREAFAGATSLSPGRLSGPGVVGEVVRCGRITVRWTYEIPALTLPGGIGWGAGFVVSASHSEIVDPYRSGLDGEAVCSAP